MNKLDPASLQQSLQDLLQDAGFFVPASNVSLVVGLSGGVDSVVLLHALFSFVSSNANSGFSISAIHVNHQLQPQADNWQKFCVDFCGLYSIELQCIAVDATPKKGEGPEAAARQARYSAFKKHMPDNAILLTGHHVDDQIETVFLQMLRGTGVDGAAGIRSVSQFNSSYLIRPLLLFSREMIEAYALENKLQWTNDPSNTEIHYDRNYLRHEILPLIQKRWPSYRQTIGRFSQHMREASELLSEIAEQDFNSIFDEKNNSLSIKKLNVFSKSRANNLIRHWLRVKKNIIPSERQLEQVYTAIEAREDASPNVRWAGVELRRFKNNLYLLEDSFVTELEKQVIHLSGWREGQRVSVAGYGVLELQSCKGGGISAFYFLSKSIKIKTRQGGERCKPVGREKSQSLKKIFQEKNIAPWLRDKTPIVFIDDEIAAVVGEFYCVPFASGNDDGLKIVRVAD